jgi:nucleotide-binding universal stress UspA family protein
MRDAIGVGISGAGATGHALGWAMSRAACTGADVVLLHVLDDAVRAGDGRPFASWAGRGALSTQLRAARVLSPRTAVRLRVLRGNVMWQLAAASREFALVVVGTHKTGFIHEALYGSASLHLVAEAACPAVVVPTPSRAGPMGVLVGADDSAAGRAALGFAAEEAANTGQELTILRVRGSTSGQAGHEWGGTASRTPELLVARFAAIAAERHPGLRIHCRTLDGRPAQVLVAASSGARLLVLGAAQTSAPETLALGVVCHDALLNIRVPTVIVHGGDGVRPAGQPPALGSARDLQGAAQ